MSYKDKLKEYNEVVREISFDDEKRVRTGLTDEDKESPKMVRARELYLQLLEAQKEMNEDEQADALMEAEYESGATQRFVDGFKSRLRS